MNNQQVNNQRTIWPNWKLLPCFSSLETTIRSVWNSDGYEIQFSACCYCDEVTEKYQRLRECAWSDKIVTKYLVLSTELKT